MSADTKIAAVVVLYHQNYHKIDSYTSLLKNWPYPLLIYDNSITKQELTLRKNEEYFHNPDNPGVSAAYNHAIKWAKLNQCSHILLLDSDSLFPADALDLYTAEIEAHKNSIILPAMLSSEHKISPFYFKWGKSFYGDSIEYGKIQLGKVLAINSGAVIPLDFFDSSTKFNENLPLDWSDIAFFRSLKGIFSEAEHIPLQVKHGLSEHEKQSIGNAYLRYSTYLKGITFVSEGNAERFMMRFWGLLKALKLTLRYSSFKFITLYLTVK